MASHNILRWLYPLMAGIWIAAHLHINGHVARDNRAVSLTSTAVDARLPFVPAMTAVYLSGFLLSNVSYLPVTPNGDHRRLAVGYAILFVVSLTTYRLYPRRAARYESIEDPNLSARMLMRFQRISKPYNSFPSMHASYSVLSALWVSNHTSVLVGVVLMIWTGAVVAATLLTKQHTVVDVLAGISLALVAYAILGTA